MNVEVCNPMCTLRVEMIGMIGILACVSPGNMHLACGQIDHQRCDGAFTVHRVNPCNVVITDGIRQIDMVFLNRLQGLDGMCAAFIEEKLKTFSRPADYVALPGCKNLG